MVPAFIVIFAGFDVTRVLVASQVVLSFGIAFALTPLLLLTSHQPLMGELTNSRTTRVIGWVSLGVILALNVMIISFDG